MNTNTNTTFETERDTCERYLTTRQLGETADMLGSHPERMSPGRWYAFAVACHDHADASASSTVATLHVVDDKGKPITITDDDGAHERTPIMRCAVSARGIVLATHHGEREDHHGQPRWYPIGDGLRLTGQRAPMVSAASLPDVRLARRATMDTINPSMLDATIEERAAIASSYRSNGHRSGTLRFIGDALVSARLSEDALAGIILSAVLTAGSWSILRPLSADRVTLSRRSSPPCAELHEWVPSAMAHFARTVPASFVLSHVARHLYGFDATDEEVPHCPSIERSAPMVSTYSCPGRRPVKKRSARMAELDARGALSDDDRLRPEALAARSRARCAARHTEYA